MVYSVKKITFQDDEIPFDQDQNSPYNIQQTPFQQNQCIEDFDDDENTNLTKKNGNFRFIQKDTSNKILSQYFSSGEVQDIFGQNFRDLFSWFFQDFMIAYNKLCDVNSVRDEILKIAERRNSAKKMFNPKMFGNLKPSYTQKKFRTTSNLDERHLVVADKNHCLCVDSFIGIALSSILFFVVQNYEINLISQCNDIEFLCKFIIQFNIIITVIPQIIVFNLIIRQQPVPDKWVLMGNIFGMFQRVPQILMPIKNSNLIWVQFLDGIFWGSLLNLHKVGDDMFWQVIQFRINLILTILCMGFTTIISPGNFLKNIFFFFMCVFLLIIVSAMFVLSALVLDGEIERFLEGRSFLAIKKNKNQKIDVFIWNILQSVKRNTDCVQNILISFNFLLFIDSYIRLIISDKFYLAQIIIIMNIFMYLWGSQGSINFIDDLLTNIKTQNNVVSDLIPTEISEQLQKENIDSGISFRSSESGHKKTTAELNMLPKNLFDINFLAQNCKFQSQNISRSEFIWDHACVTVLYMDIVGFTSMSKKIGAINVMSMLNKLYYQLDMLSEKLGVYKIETIGDCYVVAGGLFNNEKDKDRQADRILMMAAGIQSIANSMHPPGSQEKKLMVRVGINSGPLKSGIIGKIRKRYSLFGNVTSVASKLEQSCPYGQIQISGKTFKLLQGDFKRLGVVQYSGSYIFDWKKILQF